MGGAHLALTTEQLAGRLADRAGAAELTARQVQQQHTGWQERHPQLGQQWHQVTRELAWRRRARRAAIEAERPAWQQRALGPMPATVRGRRVWRQTATLVADYRDRYRITDPEQALGPEPRGADLAQRQAWPACQNAVERLWVRTDPTRQPARTDPSGPPQRVPSALPANPPRHPGGRHAPSATRPDQAPLLLAVPTTPSTVDPVFGQAYGNPGASATAHYRRRRGAEWTLYQRTLPLRWPVSPWPPWSPGWPSARWPRRWWAGLLCWPPWWSAGACGSRFPRTPATGSVALAGSSAPAGSSARYCSTAGSSSTTLQCPGLQSERRPPGHRPRRSVPDRLQELAWPAAARPRRHTVARQLPRDCDARYDRVRGRRDRRHPRRP